MFCKEINLPPIPADIINSIEDDTSHIIKNNVNQDYGHSHYQQGLKLLPNINR